MAGIIKFRPFTFPAGLHFADLGSQKAYEIALIRHRQCVAALEAIFDDLAQPLNEFRRESLESQKLARLIDLSAIENQLAEFARTSPDYVAINGGITPFTFTQGYNYQLDTTPRSAYVTPLQHPHVDVNGLVAPFGANGVEVSPRYAGTTLDSVSQLVHGGRAQSYSYDQVLPTDIVSRTRAVTGDYICQTSDPKEQHVRLACIHPIPNSVAFAKVMESFLHDLVSSHTDIDFHQLEKYFYEIYTNLRTANVNRY